MQLDFTPGQNSDEKRTQLAALRNAYLLVVVRCGGFQVIHYGTMTDINKDGTLVALNCWSEKFRNDYTERNFTQHERVRNRAGNLIKPADKWQYIPIQLIERVVCILPSISR